MKKLIKQLRQLEAGELTPRHTEYGLCNFIATYCWRNEVEAILLKYIFESWGEHSGNSTYPVPSFSDEPPRNKFMTTKNLWRKGTKYSEARRRLSGHVANELEKLL